MTDSWPRTSWARGRRRAARSEGRPAGPYYFSGRAGSPSRIRVWQIVRETLRTAGFRHSAAVHALDSGLTTDDVRDRLRHARLASAEVYAVLSWKRRGNYQRTLAESPDIVKVRWSRWTGVSEQEDPGDSGASSRGGYGGSTGCPSSPAV